MDTELKIFKVAIISPLSEEKQKDIAGRLLNQLSCCFLPTFLAEFPKTDITVPHIELTVVPYGSPAPEYLQLFDVVVYILDSHFFMFTPTQTGSREETVLKLSHHFYLLKIYSRLSAAYITEYSTIQDTTDKIQEYIMNHIYLPPLQGI